MIRCKRSCPVNYDPGNALLLDEVEKTGGQCNTVIIYLTICFWEAQIMDPEIIQNDGSYALTLEFASGMVSPLILDAVRRIVKEEGARVHLTTSQKIMILDLSRESAQRARDLLNRAGANFKFPKQVYQPRVCVGSRYCKLGLTDTLSFGERIYERYSGLDIPYKIKIGVSGCRASCAHSTFADIGFIGRKSGYRVYVGGKSGISPVMGRALPETAGEEEAFKILGRAIELYCEHSNPEKQFQRMSDIIEKFGFERFQSLVTGN